MKAIAGILVILLFLLIVGLLSSRPTQQIQQVTSSDPSTQLEQLRAQKVLQHKLLGAK